MSESAYATALQFAAGALLLLAVLCVWRRRLATLVWLLAWQGAALATIPIVLGLHAGDRTTIAVGCAVLVLRAGILPWLVGRLLVADEPPREGAPLINVTASLLVVAALTGLAFAVTRPLIALDASRATQQSPVALAVAFLGLLIVVTRRRALSQITGFLVLDNGIAALAFLLTAGVPLIVELGASIDVLLAVLILQVLTGRMRVKFGGTDLDELRELHD
jgi:hydrogenase-4 component E